MYTDTYIAFYFTNPSYVSAVSGCPFPKVIIPEKSVTADLVPTKLWAN